MTSIKQAESRAKKKKSRDRGSRNGKGTAEAGAKSSRKVPRSPDDWPAWSKYLAQRESPGDVRQVIPSGKEISLLWGLPMELKKTPTADLLSFIQKFTATKSGSDAKVARRLEQWMAAQDRRECSVRFGLDCLAWAHALPRLASVLPAAPWCQLFELLIDVAEDAVGCDVHEDPLASQLQSGELAVTLAYVFPQHDRCSSLMVRGRTAISHALLELHDGEGLPHAQDLHLLPGLLACWTRSEWLARCAQTSAFEKDARNQYEWLVRQTIRLMRWDGSLMLSAESDRASWNKHLMRVALQLNDDAADDVIAARVLPPLGKTSKSGSRRTKEVPEPAVYSEWSELCAIRTEWKRNAPQVGVAFDERNYRCELSVAREILWSGALLPEVTIDGKRQSMATDWSETCWFSDQDADYLEVECDLTNGWVVQRQLLVARQGKFIYFADNVLGPAAAQIEYSVELPLRPGVEFRPATETHEGLLMGEKPGALVIPLGLPEWRTDTSSGKLETTPAGALVLSQTAHGKAMCAPLYVDLQSKRFDKPLTWRRLTVAEKLQIQPPDVAVGYRVQVGKSQWFLYRSLAPTANRTLLGQNLSNEFVCAKFRSDGTLDELIEIE